VPLVLVVDNRFVIGPAMFPRIDDLARRIASEHARPDGD
jgi:hypothetical protein